MDDGDIDLRGVDHAGIIANTSCMSAGERADGTIPHAGAPSGRQRQEQDDAMSDLGDGVGSKRSQGEASQGATGVRVLAWGDKPYPLFPCDDGEAARQDVQLVTCRRLRKDHTIEIPEAFDFKFTVGDWRDVLVWLGAGYYQAIGFDAHHRVVAEYPRSGRGWLRVSPALEPHICNPPPAVEALHPQPAAAPVDPGLAGLAAQIVAVLHQVVETLRDYRVRLDRLEHVLLATGQQPSTPGPRGKPN
jgi:hypothetical protein